MSQDHQSNPRDTQFAGFARLLFEELQQHTTNYVVRSVDELEAFRQEYRAIIARRAYDLATHSIDNVNSYDISRLYNGILSHAQVVETIPDLTQWPEEAK